MQASDYISAISLGVKISVMAFPGTTKSIKARNKLVAINKDNGITTNNCVA